MLTGSVGRDIFVLGNATTAFYDDGNSTTSSFGNYALITDFNLSYTTNQLIVKGNVGDSIVSTEQGWLFEATTTLDSN